MVPNGFAAKMGAGKGGLYFVLDFHSNVGHTDDQSLQPIVCELHFEIAKLTTLDIISV